MDFSAGKRSLYGTARLVDMGAITELAACHQLAQLRKVPIQFLRADIPQCHGFQAGSIYHITSAIQVKQLAHHGGVPALSGRLADSPYRQPKPWLDKIKQAGLTRTRGAGKT
jgi:hypothetical protein